MEENGLINKELIMKAWRSLRENEFSIPNETLDFMRDSAIEKLTTEQKDDVCPDCGGDGWTIEGGAEHHPLCDGNCSDGLCPVDGRYQKTCPTCNGTGKKQPVWETVKEWEERTGEKYPEDDYVWHFSWKCWCQASLRERKLVNNLYIEDNLIPPNTIVPIPGEGHPPKELIRKKEQPSP